MDYLFRRYAPFGRQLARYMLDLRDLDSGNIRSITPALGAMLAEAAGVCLESQGHAVGVQLLVRRGSGSPTYTLALAWPTITEQAVRAWNDDEYATEHGAVAIAVLLVSREFGYTPIEASRRGTGHDYWLGDASDEPFQRKGRLEVSGIRRGDDRAIRARVQQKLRQTGRSDDSLLPAYVIVVEFSRPVAEARAK